MLFWVKTFQPVTAPTSVIDQIVCSDIGYSIHINCESQHIEKDLVHSTYFISPKLLYLFQVHRNGVFEMKLSCIDPWFVGPSWVTRWIFSRFSFSHLSLCCFLLYGLAEQYQSPMDLHTPLRLLQVHVVRLQKRRKAFLSLHCNPNQQRLVRFLQKIY